jgi:cardiolipin synthase
MILTLLLVFLQLAIILSFNFFFMIGLKWYLVLQEVLSIITAISVLSSHRSGQAKAVWVLFILVFFMFGYIVYFMSNDKIMYRSARSKHKKIHNKTSQYIPQYDETDISEDIISCCRYLHNAGGFVPYTHTKLQYFSSGTSMFDDLLENLKTAQNFVFIEYFAISDGVLINRFLDILEPKIKDGLKLCIIYDDIGSRDLSAKTRRRIRKMGGDIRVFNKLLSRFSFALNYRDHRKIVVIDGKVAYTGGTNLADEYINEKRMYGYWKDTGLKIRGDAIDGITMTFLRQWEYIVKRPLNYADYLGKYEKFEKGDAVIPYIGGPEFEMPICKNLYENVIAAAKQKLYIMTPYFVPDEGITQLIINAALSGVDVRIVLPSVPDKLYVYLLTKDNAEKLISCGVKIYYVEDAFVHSKIVLTENCAVVGSVNFDMRSFYQQFENSVISDDKKLLADINADFKQAFADSLQVTKPERKGLIKTVAVKALRIVGPLM